jgi:hypothetical protein
MVIKIKSKINLHLKKEKLQEGQNNLLEKIKEDG